MIDIGYYDEKMLGMLLPKFKGWFTIEMCGGDLEEYAEEMGRMPRGYWDVNCYTSVWFDYKQDRVERTAWLQCDAGVNNTRAEWLRNVVGGQCTHVAEWDSLDKFRCYATDQTDTPRFLCEMEYMIWRETLLSWFEEWDANGAPVRELDFDGDVDHPVFGGFSYV